MGSDEIFSGYRKHQAIQLKNKLNFIPSFLFNNLDKVTKNIPVKSNYRGFKFIRWVKRFLNILKYSDNNDDIFEAIHITIYILNELFSLIQTKSVIQFLIILTTNFLLELKIEI